MSRFSKAEIVAVRNEIDINFVIHHRLKISQRHDSHFYCPLCGHSEKTNTDHRTNLARCFDCRKNFNNIDLVIICQNLSFVDAVSLLLKDLNNGLAKRRTHSAFPSNQFSTKKAKVVTSKKQAKPKHISQIVNQCLAQYEQSVKNQKTNRTVEIARIELQKIRALLADKNKLPA